MQHLLQSPLRTVFAIVAVLACWDALYAMVVLQDAGRAVSDWILVALCAIVGLLDTIRRQLNRPAEPEKAAPALSDRETAGKASNLASQYLEETEETAEDSAPTSEQAPQKMSGATEKASQLADRFLQND